MTRNANATPMRSKLRDGKSFVEFKKTVRPRRKLRRFRSAAERLRHLSIPHRTAKHLTSAASRISAPHSHARQQKAIGPESRQRFKKRVGQVESSAISILETLLRRDVARIARNATTNLIEGPIIQGHPKSNFANALLASNTLPLHQTVETH